jgi:peroxiredoxin
MTTAWRWGAWAAAGAVVLAVVWILTRPLGPADGLSGRGDAFFAIGAEREGIGIGQSAPELEAMVGGHPVGLESVAGVPVRLANLAGRPTWIVFGATWCGPCREEIPALRAAYQAGATDGLQLLWVSISETADAVAGFAADQELPFPVALDRSGAVAERYGVWGYPTHYFIDADGVVRARYLGPMTAELIDQYLPLILAPAVP